MIEMKLRVLIDTQDPDIAYDSVQQALRFSGLRFEMSEVWMVNNREYPATSAQRIAWNWQKRNPWRDSVRFTTTDLTFQTKLDTLRSTKHDS